MIKPENVYTLMHFLLSAQLTDRQTDRQTDKNNFIMLTWKAINVTYCANEWLFMSDPELLHNASVLFEN